MVGLRVIYTGNKPEQLIDLGDFNIHIQDLLNKIQNVKTLLQNSDSNNQQYVTILNNLQQELDKVKQNYDNVVKDIVQDNSASSTQPAATATSTNKYLKYKNKYLQLKKEAGL
jgi:uncharacterized coiled-coil DUF342 family protein